MIIALLVAVALPAIGVVFFSEQKMLSGSFILLMMIVLLAAKAMAGRGFLRASSFLYVSLLWVDLFKGSDRL